MDSETILKMLKFCVCFVLSFVICDAQFFDLFRDFRRLLGFQQVGEGEQFLEKYDFIVIGAGILEINVIITLRI